MRQVAIERRWRLGAIAVATGLVGAAGSTPLRAGGVTWTGDDDKNWHNSSNWDPQRVPRQGDNVSSLTAGTVITVSMDTAPIRSLTLQAFGANSFLVTQGRVFVDTGNLTGRTTVHHEFTVSVNPNGGQPGLDTDILLLSGGTVQLFDGIVHVGGELEIRDFSSLEGSGEVLLLNEMGGATRVLDLLQGSIRANSGTLLVRALGGGRIRMSQAFLSATELPGSHLIIDGELETVFDSSSRMTIDDQGSISFTHPLQIHGDVIFRSTGAVLSGPRFDFVSPTMLSVSGEDSHATIEAITTFLRAIIEVTPDSELTFAQPVAFGTGSTINVGDNATLRCMASTTYSGGTFTGEGSLSQFGELNVLESTTIDMPDGFVNLGDTNGIDIDLFSGANLTITARSIGGNNTISGSTNVQEAVLDITTVSPTGIGGEMILNSAILQGSPMIVHADARIETIGFQDAIDAAVTYAAQSDLVVNSSRLFVNGTTTLEGAQISGTGVAQFNGDIIAIEPESGVLSAITLDHTDWDGNAEASHRTIIQPGARLSFFEVESIESTLFDGYDGSIFVGQGGTLGVSVSPDSSWKMDGLLTLDTATVGGDELINRGRFEGNGTVAFVPLTSTGVVAPGLPTGQITVRFHPYTQTTFGTLEIELGGSVQAVDYDFLRVEANNAVLAGTLHVRLLNGFVPKIGQQFTVLTTATPIQGEFEEIIDQAGVTVTYTSTSVILTYVGGVDAADVNGDGVVSFADLLQLLEAWGPCPRSRPCPEDINGDGVVDFADLLIVLAQWT